ncbi:class A beta-lactamase [Larkinella soli]|uniref:class A beta-lactamase n=1 Tax=Larkinella soli TaxID=1770527 RepID=UPI000FFBAC40|nr:class A beta-lactamase [Larkinella soli]
MRILVFVYWIVAVSLPAHSQKVQNLKRDICQIISQNRAHVGISIKGFEKEDTININANDTFPLMSVFKFHIALAVLQRVDDGVLKLTQKVLVEKSQLHSDTWSPMRDQYPHGQVYLSLDEILRYTVSNSDNNGCDILLNLIGGAKGLQKYIRSLGADDFTVSVNEFQMRSWENSYLNYSTPMETTKLLEKFYNGLILKANSTDYLYRLMVETTRGTRYMKSGLPQAAEIAHRPGLSGLDANKIRIAMNDVGIVKLPNGQYFIISIFLKDIMQDDRQAEEFFSEVARLTWEYFTK